MPLSKKACPISTWMTRVELAMDLVLKEHTQVEGAPSFVETKRRLASQRPL